MVTTALLWIVAIVLIVAGLAGLVLPALPGPVLLFAGFVVGAWAEDFRYVGVETLGVLGLLAIVAYIAGVAAGSVGAAGEAARGRGPARGSVPRSVPSAAFFAARPVSGSGRPRVRCAAGSPRARGFTPQAAPASARPSAG